MRHAEKLQVSRTRMEWFEEYVEKLVRHAEMLQVSRTQMEWFEEYASLLYHILHYCFIHVYIFFL